MVITTKTIAFFLSYVTFISIAFYCTPVLQKVYLFTSSMILVIGFIIAIFGASNSKTASLIRNGGFGSLVAFGVVPIARKLLFYNFIILLISYFIELF